MIRSLRTIAAPGVVLAVVLLAGNAWLAIHNTRILMGKGALIQGTQAVMIVLGDLHGSLAEAAARQRAFLLTNDADYLTAYKASEKNARDIGDRALHLTTGDAVQQGRLREVVDQINNEFVILDAGVKRRLADSSAPQVQPAMMSDETAKLNQIRDTLNRAMGEERQLLSERRQESNHAFWSTVLTFSVSTGIAILLLIIAYQLVRRDERLRAPSAADLAASESRKAAVFDAVLDCLITMDDRGRVVEWNDSAVETFGYTREQAVGHELASLIIPEELREAHRAGLAKYLRTGEGPMLGRRVEVTAVRADGSRIPVELAITTFGSGAPAMFIGYLRNLTARKNTERMAKSMEERSRLLLEFSGEGIYGIDLSGNCTFINRAAARILGLDADATRGKHMHSICHHTRKDGTVYPESECPGHRAMRTSKGDRVDDEIFWRSDGTSFPVEYSCNPVIDDGKVSGVVMTFADITERKRGEEQIRRARDDAEAANIAKSQFLANMSHELRTPLNAVIMYSELLEEEATDAGAEKFIPDLDKIRAAGHHLLALVNGVLDLSKIEAGKMELYLETFDVSSMVADVATTLKPLAESKSNQLVIESDASIGTMRADLTKVRQILFNVLSNACKFTENGTVTLRATRESENGSDWIIFQISDTGIGMTPAQLENLFQPFTQGDASTTRRFGGTGLGLAITRRFCEMMGGEVTARSEEKKGSTFIVRLPGRVGDSIAANEKHGGAAPRDATPTGMPVALVIDDEPSVRDLMTRFLTNEGMRAFAAADGEEGIRIAREIRPQIIFLDVLMPKLDGWAVLGALKSDPDLHDTPVVMLTILDSRDVGFVLGASEYLTKPIDRDRLAKVVKRYRPKFPGDWSVLIVEDDEPTRQVLRRSLDKLGWKVIEAENGKRGIEALSEATPRLILLDLMMPEMDGFEFLNQLRKMPAGDGVPIIVLTSKDLTPGDRARLAGNVERILQKGDYSREALLREVRAIVAGYVGGGAPAIAEVKPAAEAESVGDSDVAISRSSTAN